MKYNRLIVALVCVQFMLVTVFAQPNRIDNGSQFKVKANATPASSVTQQKRLEKIKADMKSLYDAMNDEENPPDASQRRQYNNLRDEQDRLSGVKKVVIAVDDQSSNENLADASPMSPDEVESIRKENQKIRDARDAKQKQVLQNNYEDELRMAFPDYSLDKVKQIVVMTVAKIKANPTAVPKDPDMLKVWKIYRKYFLNNA